MSAGRLARWRALSRHRPVRWALVAVVILILSSRMDRAALLSVLRGFDPVHGLAMLLVCAALLGLFAWRWSLIAHALGIPVRYGVFLRGLWLSQAMAELGPPLLVGELARFRFLRGLAEDGRLLLSQIVDRCSGHAVLLLMAVGLTPWLRQRFSLPAGPVAEVAALGLLLLGAIAVGGWLAARLWPFLGRYATELGTVLNPLRRPGHFLLSLLIQLLLVLNLVLAAAGLGLAGSLVEVALLAPLLLLGVSVLPGMVSDWGKREAAAVILLAPAGLSAEQSLAVSLVYGAAHLLVALPGALWLGLAGEGPQVAPDRPPR